MQLYPDPVSRGDENALKRTKQMAEVRWTPMEFCVAQIDIIGDRTACGNGDALTVTFAPAAASDEMLGWIVHSPQHSMKKAAFLPKRRKRKRSLPFTD